MAGRPASEGPRPVPTGAVGPGAAEGTSSGWSDLALLVVLGILWGSAYPVIRAGIVGGAPPLVFAAARYGLSAVILVPLAHFSRAKLPTRAEAIPVALFGGMLIVGFYGVFLYLGEASISGGLAAVLTASVALWSAVIAYPLLPQERLSRQGVLGLLVGFAGVALLVLPDLGAAEGSALLGSLLVLLAVMSFSAGGVFLRRTSEIQPTMWTLAIQFSVAGLLTGGAALALREPASLGTASVTLPALAYLVAAPSLLGYTIYFRLHHRVGPSRANLVGYIGPVAAVVLGLLLFGETIGLFEVGGLVLIVAGLFLVQRARLTPHPGPTDRAHRS